MTGGTIMCSRGGIETAAEILGHHPKPGSVDPEVWTRVLRVIEDEFAAPPNNALRLTEARVARSDQ